MSRAMTMRTYKATVRKVHEAYVALAAAVDTANNFEPITAALAPMQGAINALRVQVCGDCSNLGYFAKPGDPYTSYGCTHENVPFFDVRTGEERPA